MLSSVWYLLFNLYDDLFRRSFPEKALNIVYIWCLSASVAASLLLFKCFWCFLQEGKQGYFVAMLDPLENNLFDLPDYENTEDEKFPPLPPPASPGRDDAEWAQANGGEHPGPQKNPILMLCNRNQ